MTDVKKEIEEGQRATRLLHELSPVFTAMRGQLIMGFEHTRFDQTHERDEIWRQFRALKALESNLQSMIDTGKMAESNT